MAMSSSLSPSSPKPTVFIIGFGSNIGAGVARKFKKEGFNVAVASRTVEQLDVMTAGYLAIKMDVGKDKDIEMGFEEVERVHGPAAVVIYNVAHATFAPAGPSNPLSVSFQNFYANVALSGVHAFEVARLANAGFDRLPETTPRAFIATGNILSSKSMPPLAGLCAGKRVLASIIETCAEAYGPSGKRFYYAMEVSPQGGPANPPDADTHGLVYHRLYRQKAQGHWEVRFVRGGALWQTKPKSCALGIALNA
ncbi:hypothetical protein FRB90_010297 [Tulasnella sp. 427]|nr:hypothetical protein FRB90_010297 [Tulasnella sp. 427]